MRKLVVAAVLIAMPVLVRGDDHSNLSASGSSELGDSSWMSPKEREVFNLVNKDQLVTARRLTDALLADDPDSIIGHWALGQIFHESEGVLGSAIYHLGRARELFEERFPPPVSEGGPWKFHRELVLDIAQLAAEVEDYDYELAMLEYHDQLYRPERIGERAWPLMKLGRLDEAREMANKAKEMRDPGEKSLGLNVLCAIERGTEDRDAAFKACKEAYDNAKALDAQLPDRDPDHQSSLAVHAYNSALAARANFMPLDAEQMATAGTRRLAFTPANPWRFLVSLYLDEGRGSDAANALREMQRWRLRQPPELRDQDRAENDVAIAIALMLAGRGDRAVALVDRALEFPDRRGLTSTGAWQAHAANLIVRRAVRRTEEELLAEAASTGDDPRGGRLSRVRESARQWADDEALAGELDDNDRLVDTMMLFGERGVTPLEPWLVGELIPVLGAGVFDAVIDRAKDRPHPQQLESYWTAFTAESLLARGKSSDARATAEEALKNLPETEILLRARTVAVEALAAHEDGDDGAELGLLERAYTLDPSVIRRMGLVLPATFSASGSKMANQVAEMLRKSPRFRADRGGFRVDVQDNADQVRICLSSAQGNLLRCIPEQPGQQMIPVPEQPPKDKDGKEIKVPPPTAADFVEQFHRDAFAMPLGLSQVDYSSLDGSSTMAEQAVRTHVDQMLDELAK
ncbi:MAG TPA: hypothetical protein VGF94_21895 [Kofleriaceae bacterium]